MKLKASIQSIDFEAYDMHGEKFSLSDYRGSPVILSFFRNTNCPFCLKRVFELATHQHRWMKAGVKTVTVFSSPSEEMQGFHKSGFKRFKVLPDPKLTIYNLYGIEKSFSGLVKGLMLKMPTVINGFSKGAKVEKNPNGLLLPADFLIDPTGKVIEAWYGDNAADNIPIAKIFEFVNRMAKEQRTINFAAYSTRIN